jgi:tetratricopeptide (TPR) repeat protein
MNTETAKSLFIVSSMPALYQQLLSGIRNYEQLAARILQQIKVAHAFRRIERVRELATTLSNIPIKEYQLIGQYYLVCYSHRESVFKAAALEKLAEQTRTYKANILLSRAFIEGCRHKMEAALYFYNEALKTSPAISDYISVSLGIAQVKGIEGFHHSALKDIENLLPIIRYAEPRLFFDLLNSYATELGAIDRLDEARSISRIVLASPFIQAYPVWRETAEELREANRSTVAVSSTHYNVLTMPEREASEQRSFEPRPARVLDLSKWKKKMARKAKDKQTEQFLEDMSLQDMGFKLLGLISDNRMDEDQMRIILTFVMNLLSEPIRPPDKPSA